MIALPDKEYFNRWFVLEALAVLTGGAYTILITYGSIWCWPMAIISACLFIYLCGSKQLFAETVLQLFYLGMGIYGWMTWGAEGDFKVITWGWETNAYLVAGGAVAVAIIGTLLNKYTTAKMAYVDSFTTIFSFVATWLMIHTVFENWVYWLVIDSISVFMYANRGLYLSSILFLIYTIMSVNGFYQWVEQL